VSVLRLAFVIGLKLGYTNVSQDVNSKGYDSNVTLLIVEANQPDLKPMHDCSSTSNIEGVHPTTQGPVTTLATGDAIGYVRDSEASPVTMCAASDDDGRADDAARKNVRALHTCVRFWDRLGRLCVFCLY